MNLQKNKYLKIDEQVFYKYLDKILVPLSHSRTYWDNFYIDTYSDHVHRKMRWKLSKINMN